MKVALDTANGAASTSARQIFADLGAQITVIGETPDGLNINLECWFELIQKPCKNLVKGKSICIGLAFDG